MKRPSAVQRSDPGSGRVPRYWWPVSPAILILVVACVIVFLLTTFAAFGDGLFSQLALSTERVVRQSPDASVGEILITFISHAFVHTDGVHLGLNLLWLYVFGQPLAIRLGATPGGSSMLEISGTIVFLAFFLSAAVFSGMVFVLANLTEPVLLVGGSGAISAVTAAAIRVTLRRYQPQGLAGGKSLSIWDWKILLITALYVGSNLILATPFNDRDLFGHDTSAIAWEAHIGGFLYGLIMFSFFDRLTTKY